VTLKKKGGRVEREIIVRIALKRNFLSTALRMKNHGKRMLGSGRKVGGPAACRGKKDKTILPGGKRGAGEVRDSR